MERGRLVKLIGGAGFVGICGFLWMVVADSWGFMSSWEAGVQDKARRDTIAEWDQNSFARRIERLEEENNKANANAKAIERLEAKILQLESASGSGSTSVTEHQVAALQQRVVQLEEMVREIPDEVTSSQPLDNEATLADLQAQLTTMVDNAFADRLSAADNSSGAEIRAGVVAARVPVGEDGLQNSGLLWEFEGCRGGGNDKIFCEIKITNQTREDRKACLSDVEIVTDTGYHFDKHDHRYLYVGSSRGTETACATIPPLVTINASTETFVHGRFDSEIALIRYRCGNGCEMALYDKAISQ